MVWTGRLARSLPMTDAAMSDIEVFSALDDRDILEPCRVTRVRGSCSVCGFAAVGGLHCPSICHGQFCSVHCPVCTGAVAVSEAERQAMTNNRAAQDHAEPVTPVKPVSQPCKPRGAWHLPPYARLPLDAQLHILKTRPFRGARGECWSLLSEGMTVRTFLRKCSNSSLDGRQHLLRFIRVYGCVEVR
jgi:hypothetical protein